MSERAPTVRRVLRWSRRGIAVVISVHGDGPLAAALANHAELVGLPIDTPWTKRYAFGLVPIGDAFLAWSKTARPWVLLLVVLGAVPWLPALVRRRRIERAARERGVAQ